MRCTRNPRSCWVYRDQALHLATSIFSWLPSTSCLAPRPSTGSSSGSGSGTGTCSGTRQWRPCDDDDSAGESDGTVGHADTDSDDGPAPGEDMFAGTVALAVPAVAAQPSPLPGAIVWGAPSGHSGFEKQACLYFKFFSCGGKVRPDCVDRARKHAIMEHSKELGRLLARRLLGGYPPHAVTLHTPPPHC